MGTTESSDHSTIRLGVDLSDLLAGVELGDLGAIVEAALERLAVEVGADIAFAALLAGDQIDQVWEWTGPSVERGDPPRRGQTLTEAFGPAVAFLEADEPCPVPDLSQIGLTDEQQQRFADIRAEALLLVPVSSHGHLVGVTGFLTVGRTRLWIRRDVEALRLFSSVLLTAVLRSRSGASAAAARIRATRIASFIPEGLVTATTDGVITWASPKVVDLLGREPASLVGLPVASLTPGFEADLDALARQAIAGTEVRDVSVQVPLPDGRSRWFELTMALAGDGVADPTAELLVVIRDVDGRRKALDELEHAAAHDSLTGALNRWGLRVAYEGSMSAARPVFIALVDVDHFKAVNDAHGHLVGDRVLVDLVATLRELAGDDGLVGRLGGDEFVLVSADVLSTGQAHELCVELCERLHVPTGAGSAATVSIGAVLSTQAADLGDLMAHADQAVYRAKAAGRASFELELLSR